MIRDLVDTMRVLDRCVGLAAPQIGEPVRVAVVDVSSHPAAHAHNGLLVLVNPVMVASDGRDVAREGCQSLPGITADVARARRLIVSTEASPGVLVWSAGFEARAVQHELDHLDGILILDRVASVAAIHTRRPGVRDPAGSEGAAADLHPSTSPSASKEARGRTAEIEN